MAYSQTPIALSDKIYFGYSASDALSYFKTVYGYGTQNKAYYLIALQAYENNETQELPIIAKKLAGIIAVDFDVPVSGLTFEQKKVGGMHINVFSDLQFSQITMNLVETKENDVLESLQMYRKMVANRNGTVNEPAKYAMILSFALYDSREGRDVLKYTDRFLVAMSLETLQGLSAKDPSPLEIPIVFNVLDPYIIL